MVTFYQSVRDKALTKAYNAVTGQDDETWNPDKTWQALNELWDAAEVIGFEIGRLDG